MRRLLTILFLLPLLARADVWVSQSGNGSQSGADSNNCLWTNTAAGTTYWTNSTGFSGFVIVGGGTITGISLNGTTLGMTNATVPVSLNGKVGVTYSAAPSMVFVYQ